LLVYDVTSRASFAHAEDWLKDVREHADPNLTCILVANKLDLVLEEDETTSQVNTNCSGKVYKRWDWRLNRLQGSDGNPRPSVEAPNDSPPRKSTEGASTIGRKSRLKKREVSREEAERWAKEHDVLFIEASAKTGVNVDAAFDQAARDILRKIKQGIFDDGSVSLCNQALNPSSDVSSGWS
jgi:Ras-related protein Rab-2A